MTRVEYDDPTYLHFQERWETIHAIVRAYETNDDVYVSGARNWLTFIEEWPEHLKPTDPAAQVMLDEFKVILVAFICRDGR